MRNKPDSEAPRDGGQRRHAEISRDPASLQVRLLFPAVDFPAAAVILLPGPDDIAEHVHSTFLLYRFLDAGLGTIEFTVVHRPPMDDPDRLEEEFVEDVEAAYRWACSQPEVDKERLGVAAFGFGAVIGTRAVRRRLIHPGALILCGPYVEPCGLANIHIPSLMIVGACDDLLQSAKRAANFSESVDVATVPGAGRFFEEPGAMQKTADLAIDWFTRQLTGSEDHLFDPDMGGGD